MAFKRIVANSEEDLEKIIDYIKNWFKNSSNYKTEEGTEKRKFQDPDTKEISEKDIYIIKVQEPLKDKNGRVVDNKKSTIKFVPMIEKGQMKVEIGGEGETVIASKIKDQVEMSRTRDNLPATPLGKFKSYSKDKKVALKEEDEKPKMLDKIKRVLDNYKNQTIELDYESGSEFANFIDALENTRLFKGSEDALSDFIGSKIFKELTNEKNYNIKLEEPGYSPRKLKLAPEKPSNPSDSKPRQARDMSARPGATPGATSLTDFDLQELLKKGKVKTSVLKEIIKREYKK
jgi:hypothetical protein